MAGKYTLAFAQHKDSVGVLDSLSFASQKIQGLRTSGEPEGPAC